ncbi:MAG: tRNA pseudouridine(55) synthase TruB [Ruminococcaceae bacterium]|nr:tRNA pseudouridine(55) synthase TruB [Oscillospiraceae bacterium]
MNGILCLDKDREMTSFLGCAILRRLLGVKKIGHAGTLDPNATGVLPLLIGNATKALDRLPAHDKRYTATLRFGAVSDTLDVWGQVQSTGAPLPHLAAIEQALPAFRGDIRQIPPMTSALKKDGVRLYELARKGIEIDREARNVSVYTLNIVDYSAVTGELTLDCHCSKGTYIRSLCDDLGRVLGCGAVMTDLRRTMAAGYTLDQCITVEQARQLAAEGTLAQRVLPTDTALSAYPAVTVTAPQAVRFQNGGALALDRLRTPVEGITRVYDPEGVFLGLGNPQDGELKVDKLLKGVNR